MVRSIGEVDEQLRVRWHALVDQVGVPEDVAGGLLADLLERHREPQRHYHTGHHVLAVLEHLDTLDPTGRPSLRLAAYFHDAIYHSPLQPGAASNEERSALLLERKLADLELGDAGPAMVADAAALIRATEGHRLIDTEGADLFLDADLSILGAGSAVYAQYAEAIRNEYAHVDDHSYRLGRAAVLEGFAARDQLYFSEPGRQLWEQQARENIAAELKQLRG